MALQTSSSAGLLQALRCSSLQQLRAELTALMYHWSLHVRACEEDDFEANVFADVTLCCS